MTGGLAPGCEHRVSLSLCVWPVPVSALHPKHKKEFQVPLRVPSNREGANVLEHAVGVSKRLDEGLDRLAEVLVL